MGRVLRFCSWNIQVGLRRESVLEVFRHHPDLQKLDVLALQEASTHLAQEDASSIANVLGSDYRAYQHVYHFLHARPQANGLVWNETSVRLTAIDHHTLPNPSQVAVPRAEKALLSRLRRQPRVNLVGEGLWGERTLRVCAAHLDVVGYRFKQSQFRAVLNELRGRAPADVTILAGDFNTFAVGGHPNWGTLKRDAAELGLKPISDKIKWTQSVRSERVRTLRLRQKLDEIFVASSTPYRARVWTLDIDGSDHLPVVAELEFD